MHRWVHQIAFSRKPNNSPVAAYTSGVTSTGTPGSSEHKQHLMLHLRTTGIPCYFIIVQPQRMGNTAQTISPTSEETQF